MKNLFSTQTVILKVAAFLALICTFYVGNFSGSNFSFYWNTLLVNITFMGDAFFAFCIVFFLIFFYNKKSSTLKLLIALSITLLITQFIKNIFSGLVPQLFFEEGVVQNANEILYNRNIISSHTAIAFTLAIFCVSETRKLFLKITFVLIAFLVAITRIELAGETLSALVVGLLPATIASVYLYNIQLKKEVSKYNYYYKTRKEINRINREYLLGH